VTAGEIDEFVGRLPEHVLLVLDEAYGDFAQAFTSKRGGVYSRALDYVREGRNVVLLKTFSKAHGLSGLRVGYGIGPPPLISLFRPMRVIFSVSSVAQAAAAAALGDSEHIQRAVRNNTSQAEIVSDSLKDLGYPVPETWGNFLFCVIPNSAAQFADRLRQHGVVVQPLEMWGAPQAIRVTIGTPEQNRCFLNAMKKMRTQVNR
jgi:histidinol-phosphate aminotransferase